MAARRVMLGALLGIASLCASGPAALAQTAPAADRETLFAQILRDPGNVELALRYAELSDRAGDIEAAIGTLERALFFNPAEPNTRLFLGILYAKIGSFEMARGYFDSVREYPGTPEPIRQRAAFLAAQAAGKTEASQWRGYLRTGLRFQSNANYGSNGDYFVFAPPAGFNFNTYVPASGERNKDGSVYLQGGVSYAYDLGNQRGDRFEADLSTYNTEQFDLDQFDFNFADAILGMRFGLPGGTGVQQPTIKPYLVIAGAVLGGDPYFGAFGGGVEVTAPFDGWTLAPFAQTVWREYGDEAETNTFEDGFGGGLSGLVTSAGLRVSSDPLRSVRFSALLGYERRDVANPEDFDFSAGIYSADGFQFLGSCGICGPFSQDFESYNRLNVDIQVPFDLRLEGHQLLVTPSLGLRYTRYDAPNPFTFDEVGDLADGGRPIYETREDVQFRAGLALDYALSDSSGIGAQVYYTNTASNLDAFDIDTLTVSFGPQFRF